MERNHEFTVELSDDGSYAVELLSGVATEHVDGRVTGSWPAFGLEATGDTDDEVSPPDIWPISAPG